MEVGCFEYSYVSCDASLSVSGIGQLVINSDCPFPGPDCDFTIGIAYTYDAIVLGGSGNYSYSWTVRELPNVSSSTSQLQFEVENRNIYTVDLTVTDNVTGCVYTWNSMNKRGLEVLAAESELFVGPNPVRSGGEWQLWYVVAEEGRVTFELYDLMGQRVRSFGDVPSQAGANQLLLSATNLPAGTYLLHMTDSQRTWTKKLLVK